jgi:hypothetical protein
MNGYSEVPRLRSEQAIFVCHCEEPQATWQSRLGLAETDLGFQLVARAQDSLKVIIEPQR